MRTYVFVGAAIAALSFYSDLKKEMIATREEIQLANRSEIPLN
jgi:hypothetical protein